MVDHTSRAVQVTPAPVTATSADGVEPAVLHLAREDAEQGIGLVVAHAFTHQTRHPTTRKLLAALAVEAPVVALDMRGHGVACNPRDGQERARSTVEGLTPAECRVAGSEVG